MPRDDQYRNLDECKYQLACDNVYNAILKHRGNTKTGKGQNRDLEEPIANVQPKPERVRQERRGCEGVRLE